MKQTKKIFKITRALIIFWTSFIGLGAVVGACMFFFDPNEGFIMGTILPQMRAKLPFGDLLFSNFIFSGIMLLIVNGISNLISLVLIIKNKKLGYFLGWLFGITLMLWIGIQFYVFAPEVYIIDVLFFLFGFSQFICGFWCYVCYNQLNFKFNLEDYPNLGKNKN